MWISKVNELIGSSPESFEAAASAVIERANRTLRGITGIEVLDKRIKVDAEGGLEYRVRIRLVFDMAPAADLHW
ncbi:MAG: dodecin family protein [Proteobacteria bacterium]|nr:dodecin family protein [Pseudomonadota bacterium]